MACCTNVCQCRLIAEQPADSMLSCLLHRVSRVKEDSAHRLQVVKLSCSFSVSTPYYLITDSDMFFLHPVSALDLMDQQECQKDSGVCDARKTIAFRALNEMQPPMRKGDPQQLWIVNSAATLNVRRTLRACWPACRPCSIWCPM